jgi:hypothetical protein
VLGPVERVGNDPYGVDGIGVSAVASAQLAQATQVLQRRRFQADDPQRARRGRLVVVAWLTRGAQQEDAGDVERKDFIDVMSIASEPGLAIGVISCLIVV